MDANPFYVAMAFLAAFSGSAIAGLAHLLSTERPMTWRNVWASLLYYGMFGLGIAAFYLKDGFSWSGIMTALIAGIVVGLTGLSVMDALAMLRAKFGSGTVKYNTDESAD